MTTREDLMNELEELTDAVGEMTNELDYHELRRIADSVESVSDSLEDVKRRLRNLKNVVEDDFGDAPEEDILLGDVEELRGSLLAICKDNADAERRKQMFRVAQANYSQSVFWYTVANILVTSPAHTIVPLTSFVFEVTSVQH